MALCNRVGLKQKIKKRFGHFLAKTLLIPSNLGLLLNQKLFFHKGLQLIWVLAAGSSLTTTTAVTFTIRAIAASSRPTNLNFRSMSNI
jgi:hypothetical protein